MGVSSCKRIPSGQNEDRWQWKWYSGTSLNVGLEVRTKIKIIAFFTALHFNFVYSDIFTLPYCLDISICEPYRSWLSVNVDNSLIIPNSCILGQWWLKRIDIVECEAMAFVLFAAREIRSLEFFTFEIACSTKRGFLMLKRSTQWKLEERGGAHLL